MIESGDKEELVIDPGQPVETDVFRPEDAPGIANLFQSVYGDGYPIRLFYDPKALIKANEDGTCYSLVARTSKGEVVAAEHLFRSAPCESVYEAGAGLVLRSYRNQGITKRMLQFIFDQWVPTMENIEETVGEPVCNRPQMQRIVAGLGHVETALEVALMPAEAYSREQSALGRVSALQSFRCYKARHRSVFVPAAYEDQVRLIYSRIAHDRDFSKANQDLPTRVTTRADMKIFDFAKVARIALHETGADLEERIIDLENQARAKGCVVLQVWLKLDVPWVGAAVEAFNSQKYFFGGVLPRWFDEDGLLVQKVSCNPDFESIQVHSDWTKTILGIVRDDWTRVTQG